MKRATEVKEKAMETMKAYPKTVKVADRIVSMVLNYVDFGTDVVVVLSYGCYTNNNLTVSCNQDAFLSNALDTTKNTTTMEEAMCEPQWWWFGIGLTLLVCSTILQAAGYGGSSGSCVWGLLSLCQLSYVRDVYLATQDKDDETWDPNEEATDARDAYVKLAECVPQLYLQSYILFAIGAHGHFVNVFSTVVSVASLSYGITKWFDDDTNLDLKGKILVFLFLATDQLLRASAYAFVFSEAVRPIGLTLSVVFLIGLSAVIAFWKQDPEAGGIYLAYGHVVPFLPLYELKVWYREQSEKRMMFCCLIMRYIEMIIYGILGLTVAKTACGDAPVNEVQAFFVLLAVNVALLILLYFCGRKNTSGWIDRE